LIYLECIDVVHVNLPDSSYAAVCMRTALGPLSFSWGHIVMVA